MNELNPANWIYWFGLITITCMLLPAIVVLVKRQFNAGYIALSVYFLSTFIYNLLLIVFPNFPREFRRNIGVINNFLDTPLIMLFLIQFASSVAVRKLLKIALLAFVVFEVGIVLLFGLSIKSITIFSGPGLLLILGFSFYFFTSHIRFAITQRKDIAKTLMISGILFGYAVYFMVYLFYYVLETPNKIDALIIYFFASIVTSVLLAAGLTKERSLAAKAVIAEPANYKVKGQTTLPKMS